MRSPPVVSSVVVRRTRSPSLQRIVAQLSWMPWVLLNWAAFEGSLTNLGKRHHGAVL